MTAVFDAAASVSPAHEQPTGQPRSLAGFAAQLRFMIRRDRVRAVVWFVAVVGLVALSAASVLALYSTPEDLASYAEVASADAAIKAITGPGYGLDEPTEGAVVMNETSLYTYVAVALMCAFMMVRHTRAEEETGRAELVRAAPVGRYATLVAAALWVSLIATAIAVGLTVVLLASGLPFAGSVAFGTASLAIGVVFVGVAGVAAQVATSGRSANAIAGAVLGASFLVRAVADVGNEWMTWFSPLGITQAIRPFADERWWVLIPMAGLAVVTMIASVVLLARRDLGAGFLQQRPGRTNATSLFATPLAMAVRLQRVAVCSWALGLAVLGFFMGLVADQAESLADNEAVADVLAQAGAGTITESFLATIVITVALLSSGFTVSSVLRLRSQELAGHAESILATPSSRDRWLWSHYTVGLVGTLLLLAVGGAATGVGYAVSAGDTAQVLPVLGAAVATFAALAVIAAFTVALVGLVVRWAVVAWSAVALTSVVGLLAGTLDLPQWFRDLSPLEHVPRMPGQPFDVVPIVILSAVALAFTVLGLVAFRHRDVA